MYLVQFLFDHLNILLFTELEKSNDERVAGIAAKAIKEIRYHVRRSTEWTMRLGNGTEESHNKIQRSFNDLWKYTGDLFVQDDGDLEIIDAGVGPDLNILFPIWKENVKTGMTEATLSVPDDDWMQQGSKEGRHTENMGHLLSELQYLQRAYPGCEW